MLEKFPKWLSSRIITYYVLRNILLFLSSCLFFKSQSLQENTLGLDYTAFPFYEIVKNQKCQESNNRTKKIIIISKQQQPEEEPNPS